MSGEARRGRLIILALSALLMLILVIDTGRAIMSGGAEDAGPFVLGLVLASGLLYGTYRGSRTTRGITVALLLLAGVTNPLLAFRDAEQAGIVLDFGVAPDLGVLALGFLALAVALALVISRPVRAFLQSQGAGGAA